MSVLLIIKLKKIIYSGENIGNDLSFQFDVKGQATHLKTQISYGQRKSFNKVVFQGTFAEDSVGLPISVAITEEDPVFHDTGSGSSSFNVQLQESEPKTYSFNANVIASGGDKGKTATFTFMMEATVHVLKIKLNNGASQTVNPDDKVFIIPDPLMPQLIAKVIPTISGSGLNAKWKLETAYPRRGALDDKSFPATGFKTLAIDQHWVIYTEFNNEFFGGDATLTCEIDGCAQQTLEFKIHGQNPDDSTAKSYIQSNQGIHWYAWAIGRHESRQETAVYNQFNTTTSFQDEPNFGPPDGWGMFQLDSASGLQITTKIVWNWKENVNTAISQLGSIRSEAQAYFDAVQRTYPSEYEAPPATYTAPGTSTAVPYLDAANIQLYNGASVVENLQNPSGGTSLYRSCWKLHPTNPSGQRWEFIPNSNDYVKKVIDEYEGNVP